MFCQKCGSQNPDNAQFCQKCGAPMGVNSAPNMGPNPNMGPGYQQGTGLQKNVAALLSYLFGWITGLIFYTTEKDRFVRFHAMQSIIFSAVFTAFEILIIIINAILWSTFAWGLITVISILNTIIAICVVGVIILCMVMAYQNSWFKLPVIGNYAEKFVK